MRKVCVVTGTRAEFGLLSTLMKYLQSYEDISLQIVATGMHLSPEFGLTYQEIEKTFCINKKIEILLSSDTPTGISKSMGLAQISFAEAYAELAPDLVVLLGDRFEILSAASTALIANIPIAHIHGGETTEGAFDEAIRHSVTKMSHLHFVSTESYRQRVIQLGESPERVFNVGAPGLDNIMEQELLSREEFEQSIQFKLGKKNIIVTFHPVTLEKTSAGEQFSELLEALDQLPDTHIIITKANADTDGRVINQMIDRYAAQNVDRVFAIASLGMQRYLSALKYMDVVVGNSSSGIIEAPSLKVATVNIGDRQKGRVKADSVIDCLPNKNSILGAINKAYSVDFQQIVHECHNPYWQGGASEKIAQKIRTVELDGLLKKTFFDLNFCQN